jgi:hypothetical protein
MRASAVLIGASVIEASIVLAFAAAGAQTAPSRSGRRALLPRAAEIALARSAAPASVSGHARVLALTDTGFVVADSGTSDVTCVVNRSWPASLEPHCFDAEGAATILPMELRRTTLYHTGRSEAQVDAEIARGLLSGAFRLPTRPAVSYMMSDGQQLVSDDGRPAGKWRPHVMVYFPFLRSRAVGFGTTPDMTVGMVAEEGSATSSIMLIMPRFVPVGPS